MTMPMPMPARPAPACEGGAIWSIFKSTSWWTDNLEPDWGVTASAEAVSRLYQDRGDLSVCSDAEEAGRAAAYERAYEAAEAARRAEAVQADGFTIAASTSAAHPMTAAEVGYEDLDRFAEEAAAWGCDGW